MIGKAVRFEHEGEMCEGTITNYYLDGSVQIDYDLEVIYKLTEDVDIFEGAVGLVTCFGGVIESNVCKLEKGVTC
jgi:hypothetical protein